MAAADTDRAEGASGAGCSMLGLASWAVFTPARETQSSERSLDDGNPQLFMNQARPDEFITRMTFEVMPMSCKAGTRGSAK